jgi:hypothetical protein
MSDEDLVHELDHMHEKRRDVFRTGHAQAWRNHLERTAQLKADYLRRFPPGSPMPPRSPAVPGERDRGGLSGPDTGPPRRGSGRPVIGNRDERGGRGKTILGVTPRAFARSLLADRGWAAWCKRS